MFESAEGRKQWVKAWYFWVIVGCLVIAGGVWTDAWLSDTQPLSKGLALALGSTLPFGVRTLFGDIPPRVGDKVS
jgi:hypothetical protein